MNSFKIKFADLLRYFILGCVELLLFYVSVRDCGFGSDWKNDIEGLPISLIIAVFCIGIYLLGYLTQAIIQLCLKGDFFCTGMGEIAEYIHYNPKGMLSSMGFPDWVYWSDNPRRVLEIYQDVLEADDSSERKTEFLYFNQFFQGLAFSTLVFFIYNVPCLLLRVFIILGIICTPWIFRYVSNHLKIKIKNLDRELPLLVFILFVLSSLLIVLKYYWTVLAFISFLSCIFASILARKQIWRIHTLANSSKENSEKFNDILALVGVPKAYILTRTNSAEFMEEELESIAKQNYPNIKVIVLADKTLQTNQKDFQQLTDLVNSYRDGRVKGQEGRKPMNIQVYESARTGPAALAYEIRKIFLNYATPDDVAIMLDSDDKLDSESVVKRIMTKLYKTGSNICLIRFEIFGKENLNYSKNYHNDLAKKLCYEIPLEEISPTKENEKVEDERHDPILPQELLKHDILHRISTIGWTKCYKKDVLENYQELLKGHNVEFDDYQKYEDFPDIIALLNNNSRICSVATNSVLFRKRAGSVTTGITTENYTKHIPYFLKLAKLLTEEKNKGIIPNGKEVVVDKLIPYKFVQYLNVIYKKTESGPLDANLMKEKFTCKKFYEAIAEAVFGVVDPKEKTATEFFENVIKIIKDDDDFEVLGDDDFPKELVKLRGEKGEEWKVTSENMCQFLCEFYGEEHQKMLKALENIELRPICGDGKYGFADDLGNIVIPYQWKDVGRFYDSLVNVMNDNEKWGYIDKTGKVVIPCKWEDAKTFSEGLARALSDNKKWGYIDKTGKVVITCHWKDAKTFSEGLAPVKNDNEKWGYIDKTGKVVIPCKWKNAQSFSEGLADVWDDDGKRWKIDKTGKIIR